jgi:hypothetical protein
MAKGVEKVDVPLAYFLCGMESGAVRAAGGGGARLPEELVIPPGRYAVHGRTYALRREGLYRFLMPGQDNQQRIVFRKEPLALLSGVAWAASHGSRDDKLSVEEWLRIARTQKLIVTCGNVARLGHQLLTQAGVPARLVGASTLGKLNNYDNGHSLLEAFLEGRWTLVDLDVKRLFRRGGRRLGLLGLCDAVAAGDYEFEPISAATGIAVGSFVENGYDYGLFMECGFSTEAGLRAWYGRIMQVPQLRSGEGRFFTVRTAAQRRRAEARYPYLTYLPREEFVRRFYPEGE